MTSPPRIFRVRIVLQANDAVRMSAFHAGTIYALLAAAHGRGRDGSPGIPDGVLIDAPEQCRSVVAAGERYAFGFTLLAHPDHASARVAEIVRGLKVLGREKQAAGLVWGGNFRVNDVTDLIAEKSWSEREVLAPIPTDRFVREVEQLHVASECTLQFFSPYRGERPNRDRQSGRGFLDRDYFPPELFARRLWDRLGGLGIVEGPPPPLVDWAAATNRLVWLDFSYGPAQARKRLGGVVGVIAFRNVSREWHRAVVWGQYVRAGLNTRFGFGDYRVAELGPAPYRCRRARTLLELATDRLVLESAAGDVPVGNLSYMGERLLEGAYQPPAPACVELRGDDGVPRRLAIPPPEDRALQRAVMHALNPGLDLFLQDASFAYRRALGRHSAARGLAMAWSDGFRWAVRSDVHRFFDSIEHAELQARLEAYVADVEMVGALMAWVRVGAPYPDRGLPTGSPLAPLLANLFLDGFDERIGADGGRLIRYADDFLILTRTREDADRLYLSAQREAAALELTLNDDKTRIVDLREPFDFLGFRFTRDRHWQRSAYHPPRLIDEIGWTDASASPDRAPRRAFPGEVDQPAENDVFVIAGPGAYRVFLEGDCLVCADGKQRLASPIDTLEAVVLLGEPEISGPAVCRLAREGVPAFVADPSLRDMAGLFGDSHLENADVVAAQLRHAADEASRLAVGRAIVAAKIGNYAVLADLYPDRREPTALPVFLRERARHCAATTSMDELLGVEGTAARAWYGSLEVRLPGSWKFPGRVAPNADDPVNVVLNLAFTYLHRWSQLAVKTAGLLPGVGILHRPRAGHAALASDLMEPFRPVMERAVIEALMARRPTDFRRNARGRFALSILPHAYQAVMAELTRALRRGIATDAAAEPRSYRRHLVGSARGLARHLADATVPWAPFCLPRVL